MFRVIDHNHKNLLLEITQRYFGVERPQYIHFDYGPHHSKVFRCVCVFHQQMTSSLGRTKIEAEQLASQAMLNKVQNLYFKKINNEWIFSKVGMSVILSSRILGILDNLKHESSFDVLSLYGDSVVRYLIAQYLYDHYSEFREGVLTLIIAEAMREETRAQVARNLKLETYLRSDITTRALAGTLSAVIGKLNLQGLNHVAKKLILDHYQPFVDHSVSIILSNCIAIGEQVTTVAIKTTIHNFKNELQEYAQKHGLPIPSYHLIGKEGVDHAPTFTVQCLFKRMTKIGKGLTVKSAEQNAAQSILENIYLEDVDQERLVRRSQTYVSPSMSRSTTNERNLSELKHHLHLPDFVKLVHLKHALTHSSLDAGDDYQRLEFLGDSILRMLIIDYLLGKYPKIIDKAFLSLLVDELVSSETQIKIAKKLQLNKYILSSARVTDGMLSDVLEALIAVIYIDAEAIGTSVYLRYPLTLSETENPLNFPPQVQIQENLTKFRIPLQPLDPVLLGEIRLLGDIKVQKAPKNRVENEGIPESLFNKAVPVIIDWFKPEIMHRLKEYHLVTDKALGLDNFPALTRAKTLTKATVSSDKQGAVVSAKKKTMRESNSIFWSAPKKQEDFPLLNTPIAKTKNTSGSPAFR